MWLFVALAVVTQTVFCKETTPQQNKTCTRSAVSVKKYGYDKGANNSVGQKGVHVSSNFTMKLETMIVREGDAGPITVQRFTLWDKDGAVRATTEILTSGERKERKHKILELGRFEDFLKSCTEARVHKMSGTYTYGQNFNSRSGLRAGTEPNRMNRNNMQGNQRKQNPNVFSQRYSVPKNQYKQYSPSGNYYGNLYQNTMTQPKNMYGQVRPPGYQNNNRWRNSVYGYPQYGYPNEYYKPYAPMQIYGYFNGNHFYGRNSYTSNRFNPNIYNQFNTNSQDPRHGQSQYKQNPSMQNSALPYTNARNPVTNIGNQQGYKPNRFNPYLKGQSSALPYANTRNPGTNKGNQQGYKSNILDLNPYLEGQSLALLYANIRNPGTNIGNQQGYKTNQFKQNQNAQNPAQLNENVRNPSGNVSRFSTNQYSRSQNLPNYSNPAHKQVKPGRHGTPIDHDLLAASPNSQLANKASPFAFKSLRIHPNANKNIRTYPTNRRQRR
ncbi:hypothetical protein Aduo_007955 [Ancylostoma duodenale]